MNTHIIFFLLSLVTLSLSYPSLSPDVSEVNIPAGDGPVLIVIQSDSNQVESILADDITKPEDFSPQNPAQGSASDVPNKGKGKPSPTQKPQQQPKPQKPQATGKPQKPPGSKPKPQKPAGKPGTGGNKPSTVPQRPPGKPQRPSGKPQKPGGKPTLLEGDDIGTTAEPQEYDEDVTSEYKVESNLEVTPGTLDVSSLPSQTTLNESVL